MCVDWTALPTPSILMRQLMLSLPPPSAETSIEATAVSVLGAEVVDGGAERRAQGPLGLGDITASVRGRLRLKRARRLTAEGVRGVRRVGRWNPGDRAFIEIAPSEAVVSDVRARERAVPDLGEVTAFALILEAMTAFYLSCLAPTLCLGIDRA